MNAHVQFPARADAGPAIPVPPRALSLLHALFDLGGPITAHKLATDLGVRLDAIPKVVSLARKAITPHGGAILTSGTGAALTYRIEVSDPHIAARLRGIAPEPTFMGFVGTQAAAMQAIVNVGPTPITIGTLARTLFGSDTATGRRRIAEAIVGIRTTLTERAGGGAVVVKMDDGDASYEWVPPDAVGVAAPDASPPAASRRPVPTGITLPPCGYAAWSFRPATSLRGASHVVIHAGETRTRILTETDVSNGYTTDRARLATLDVEESE